MPRTISNIALAELTKKNGTEPINIVEIEWVEGTNTSYADKVLPGISATIKSLDNIDEVIALSDGNTTAQISMTLFDHQGTIKALMDIHDLHLRPVRVYQHFGAIDQVEKFLIFEGRVVSPISWSEGQREVSFSALSKTIYREVGFSPDEGQYSNIPEDLIGSVWPLCFGSPLHVPAVKATNYKVGSLLNIVGQPDPTLPYKRELLQYRRDQLVVAYNFYQSVINVCKDIARPAYEIQEDYAYHIVSHDQLKQTLEDNALSVESLCSQLDKAISEWHNASSNLDKSVVEQHITSLKNSIKRKRKLLSRLHTQKVNMEYREKAFAIELENIKYEISVINRLRIHCKKIIDQYYLNLRELNGLNAAITAQQTLQASSAVIMDGTIFPQLMTKKYDVGGVTLEGIFDGYNLQISNIQPRYRNITIQPYVTDAPYDEFWLDRDDIKLNGMYIFTQDQKIIKVISQEGRLCKIDLPRKNKSKRTKAKEVDYANNADDRDAFNDAMTRLLAGSESPQVKAQIANNLPKHISPKIWSILTNNGREQTVELISYTGIATSTDYTTDFGFEKSWFKLSYGDEEISDKIYFSDNAVDFKDKIVNSMPSVSSADITTAVTKTHAGHNIGWKIKVNNHLMKPFKVYGVNGIVRLAADANKRSDQVVIKTKSEDTTKVVISIDRSKFKKNTTRLKGVLEVVLAGVASAHFVGDATATSIVTTYENGSVIEQNDITPTGGPLFDSDLEFQFNVPYKSFLVNNISIVEVDEDDNETKLKTQPTIRTINGTASEYTTRERERKIDSVMEEANYSKAITEQRDKIRDTLKQIDSWNAGDAVDIQELKKTLAFNLQQYCTIVGQTDNEDSSLSDAYRVISNEEKKLLYELEVTGYVEWVNSIRNLDEELEEKIDYEYTAEDILIIVEASPIILPRWVDHLAALPKLKRLNQVENLPNNTQAWIGQVGDKITLQGDFQEVYVANILESIVHAVYAYNNSEGVRRLQPVPSGYYVKNESNPFGQYNCTTITLKQPLKTLDPNWEDTIYVSMTSSIGPNVCDIMEWIIATYTNSDVDNDSFAHVRTLQAAYPCHFALSDKRDAFSLLQDIAHQARCYLISKFNTFYIKYIPEIPTPIATLNESNIEDNSIGLTFTQTEDIVTRLTGTYLTDYSLNKPNKIIVRRNITKYELNEKTEHYFIYNNRDLVYKSVTFWAIHYSNTYKYANVKVFLDNLVIETNDAVSLELSRPIFANTAITGIVKKANYDSASHSIDLLIWLPVLSGEMEYYKFAWPKDLTVSDVFPTPMDITTGNAGNPVSITVPTNNQFDPYSSSVDNIRPNDFGRIDVGDARDTLPKNAASELTEINYYNKDNVKINITKDPSGAPTSEYVPEFLNANHTGNGFRKKRPPVTTAFGRVLNVNPIKGEDIPAEDVEDGVDQVEYTASRHYYDISLSNGKQIYARLFKVSRTQAIREGDVVLVIYDEFNKDYVFQPPITNAPGGPR